jgi:ATP/maltotriose-dependent transcriptional regulator MalT/DNA-binding SARP family transcriptional activator
MSDNAYSLGKIVAPTLPRTILHREALISLLQEAVAYKIPQDHKQTYCSLVLLCAPAGYGKTTLLADFARSTPVSCCWLFLDQTDTDYVIFLRNLLTSVHHTFPHLGDQLAPLFSSLSTQVSFSVKNYQSVIDVLWATIAREISEHLVIFLCNYEEINESETLMDLTNYLLKKQPSQVTLVIESRAIPNISLIPLMINNKMCGLHSDALRFSAAEIVELAKLRGLNSMTMEEAEQLDSVFDGWIVGMLLGTYLGNLPFIAPDQNLLGQQRKSILPVKFIADQKRKNLFTYIVNEIFKRDEKAYIFLQSASILQQMEPIMCNDLLNISDAAYYLEHMEQEGLFVLRSENIPQSIYTCHPVLRHLLSEQLQQQSQERFIQLHRRAAGLWRARQNYNQAMYHALAANADDLKTRLLLDASKQLLQQGLFETLSHWLDNLPPTILESHPQLCLIQATVLLAYGNHTDAISLLEKIPWLIAHVSQDNNQAELSALRAEVAILHSKALFQGGKYSQAQLLCHQALTELPEDEIELRAAAEMRLGVCASLQGDFHTSILHLQQALQIWSNQLPIMLAIDIHGALANAYYLIGNFMLAEYNLERALHYCEQSHNEQGKIDNLTRKGIIHLHQGAYTEAEGALMEAMALANISPHTQRGKAYVLANLGSLYMEQERYKQALSFYEDSLALAFRWGNRSLINTTLSSIAVIYLLMGDITSALLFAEKIEIEPIGQGTSGYERVYRDLTYGMIYLYQKRNEEAHACLLKVETDLQNTQLKRAQLQAKLRLATCHLARDQKGEAAHLLDEVQHLLTNHKSYKHFVLVELKGLPVLFQLIKSSPQCAGLREVLELEAASQQEARETQTPSFKATPEANTPKLAINAFGEPVVLLDNQQIKRWRMIHAMELFFFLLAARSPLSKEHIITALWQEFDEHTNQTFHSTLHHLRKLFGEPCFVFQNGGYYINLAACYGSEDDIWYDVKEFQKQHLKADKALAHEDDVAAKTALERMVELYRGDYGRPFYNDWCTLQRDELRAAYMEAHRKLAHIAWRGEIFDECIKHWRQMLNIDNCLEEAHYGIMRCYMRQAQRSAALRQYQHCKDILQRELNIQPGPAIENLYQRLTRLGVSS